MNDLVSVIIPAFNASARIKSALESVIAQDYADIEIIVVDDASSDDTGKIAHEVLSRSSFTHRIITHDSNRGVSAARNTGIESAQGEYICFMYADDLLRENFVSSLHAEIVKGECDIAFCGLTDSFTDGKPNKDIRYVRGTWNVSGEKLILGGNVPPVYCCIYRREFIARHNLMFHEGCISGEDIEFVMKALCMAGKISYTPECLYVYVHHSGMGSVSGNKITRYASNAEAVARTAEYLAENSPSENVRRFAQYVLMPRGAIMNFTLQAMKGEREIYSSMLHDGNNIEIIRRAMSLYTLTKKPEVFFKAFMILHMPRIYYMMRSK